MSARTDTDRYSDRDRRQTEPETATETPHAPVGKVAIKGLGIE